MSSDTFPLQQASARLRIRIGAPNTQAQIAGYLEPGVTFQPLSKVEGENVSGNSNWYSLADNRFVWAGAGVESKAPVPPSRFVDAMRVKRRPDGTIAVLSPQEREAVFGTFKFDEAAPRGAIRILNNWEKDNIVTIDAKLLAHTGFRKIKVHKKAVDAFAEVFAKIENAGLQDHILTCAGTWVPRHMGWDPSRPLSSHSWGVAIDLNVAWNGYGAVPAPYGAKGSVLELVPIFESEGYSWGGHFKPQKLCDGMHFELSRLDL